MRGGAWQVMPTMLFWLRWGIYLRACSTRNTALRCLRGTKKFIQHTLFEKRIETRCEWVVAFATACKGFDVATVTLAVSRCLPVPRPPSSHLGSRSHERQAANTRERGVHAFLSPCTCDTPLCVICPTVFLSYIKCLSAGGFNRTNSETDHLKLSTAPTGASLQLCEISPGPARREHGPIGFYSISMTPP